MPVNVVAIVVAGVLSMVSGFIWYHPAVFGKKWMELSGMKMADMDSKKGGAMKGFAVGLIGAFITAYVLSLFLQYTAASTIMKAFTTSFWAWLGFAATFQLTHNVFSGKPISFWVLTAGHQLLALLISAAVLVSMA